jgi:thiamine-phosphate pyrophosphorylase
MMVDARLGPSLLRAVAAMPPRSGIVLRPYALPSEGKAEMIRAIRRIARARHHLLIHAGRIRSGFDGSHISGKVTGAELLKARRGGSFLSMPVHDAKQAARARRFRAQAIFVSPVHATRSHPDAPSLGRAGFARLAAAAGRPAIALGGMTPSTFRWLRHQGAHGWAAIDHWIVEK